MKIWFQLKLLEVVGRHRRLVNLTQQELEAFCDKHVRKSNLKYLTIAGNVRGYKISDFTALSKLPGLRELYLEDSLSQEGLMQICTLNRLEELHVYHAGKLSSLEPLRFLSNLTGLTVTTPIGWIGKLHKLPTIMPVSGMKNLRYLNVAGIIFEKDGLSPLARLAKLKKIYAVKRYWPEVELLKISNPELRS